MPLNLRASKKIQNFTLPVSYKLPENNGKFLDARNVNSIQGRLDTRFGSSRFNADPLPGKIQSLSSFVKSNGENYLIANYLGDLYTVGVTGAPEAFLVSSADDITAIHRAVTWNDRHIIARTLVSGSSISVWDGTTLASLGQAPPSAPTVASVAASGELLTANTYRVGITFYSTTTGFETNVGESAPITLTSPNLAILVSNIPPIAFNGFMDKVYIYLKNVTTNSEYLFISEIDIGTTSYTVSSESLSSQIPPTKNAPLIDGGGKYLAIFNSMLVVAGNDNYPNEVYFSEPSLPDAFNDLDSHTVLSIPGKGGVTGIAVGLFSDTVLDPFLVIFKKKSIHIYSGIGDQQKLVCISDEIGCVSADTIQVKNGVVYFLSEEGWRAIYNGRLVSDKDGDAITLGNGDIDDIFKTAGYTYGVNRNSLGGAFSVYYPTLDQYFTWIGEGANAAYTKAYVYEFEVGGFKPYEFAVNATCATLGETSAGRDVVYFGTTEGYVIKHSVNEPRSDVDPSGTIVGIDAFAILPWMPEGSDFDSTYNFRELILKAVSSDTPLTVKTFIDYNVSTTESIDYDFSSDNGGFILDVSILDEDSLGDERTIGRARADINRVGESIAIGFYQNVVGANIGLISMQIDSSKNGNRNLASDSDNLGEGGFDSETGTYFPSVSESVQLAANYLQQIQDLVANLAADLGSVSFSGFSSRFNEFFESEGVLETFENILLITYAGPQVSLSASGSGTVREKGTAVTSSTLSAVVTKRSDLIAKIEFFFNNVTIPGATFAPPSDTDSGTQNYSWTGSFSDNATFKVEVTDDGTTGGPTTVSSTATFTFVYPYYYGAGSPGLSAAAVSGLTKSVITSTASLNRTFTTTNGQVYYFSYPASYGALTSILDENGFETISDWTMSTSNITGLDSSAVSYRIYEFNNPVVAGSTNYTFKR